MDITNMQLVSAAEGLQRMQRGENVKTLEDSSLLVKPKMLDNISVLK